MQITLKPQQIDFVGATEQFCAYIGGIGTGKSLALITKALFHSKESPNNLGVIVRKNFTDLRDSTIKDFQDYTGMKINEQNKEVKLPNGSIILFRHGDEINTLKNLNAGFFGIEQAEEFGDSMTWDMLIQRLRRNCKHRTGFLIANANGHNWIYDKFVKPGPRSTQIQKSDIGSCIGEGSKKMLENTGFVSPEDSLLTGTFSPAENHLTIQATTYDFADILPPDYIKNLEANLPANLFKRYVLNSHEVAEGRVFSEYDDAKHTTYVVEIPTSWERGFVLDHGFRNPTAVLWYAIDHDGCIWLTDEHYESEKPLSHHAQRIKLRGITRGIADPSIFSKTQAGSKGNGSSFAHSIADEYRELGIDLSPASREEEYAAIARVNEFFKAGRIKVSVNLKNARQEFSNWKWKARKPGVDPTNLPEEPEDYANHLADCLKYLVQSRFMKPQKPEVKSERKSFKWWEKMAKSKGIYE